MDPSNRPPPTKFGRKTGSANQNVSIMVDFKALGAELLAKQAPKTVSASAVGTCIKSLSKDNRFFGEFVVEGQAYTAGCASAIPVGATCLITISKAIEDITTKSGEVLKAGTVWATAVAQA